MDGDGTFETTQTFGTQQHRQTKKPVPKPAVTVKHEDATWTLDLYGLGFRRAVKHGDKMSTYMRWSVTSGDLYCWFINGSMQLTDKADEAKSLKAVRLGPPFEFKTSASTQGPDAVVNVGLKDANGCTMRLARAGKLYRYIHFELSQAEKEVLATNAQYG